MHIAICLFLLYAIPQHEKDIDLAKLKEKYGTAYTRSNKLYEKLFITQTVDYVLNRDGAKRVFAGGVCGDHVKLMVETKGSATKEYRLLSKQSYLEVHLNQESGSWLLKKHIRFEKAAMHETATYETMRAQLTAGLPTASKFPFKTAIYSISVQDIFNGEGRPEGKGDVSFPIRLDKVERVTSNEKPAYQLHFTCLFESQGRNASGYVELAPHLSWMITKGGIGNTANWEVEYGQMINDVPVIKSVLYRSRIPGSEGVVPTFNITVDQAEEYLTVNQAEYDPSFYDNAGSQVRLIYLGLVGSLCLAMIVFFIVCGKRRDVKRGATPVP